MVKRGWKDVEIRGGGRRREVDGRGEGISGVRP